MSVKIILTGASGMLGQQILQSDLTDSYHFICLYRSNVPAICGHENIIVRDWSVENRLKNFHECNIIIHLAAETRSSNSKKSKLQMSF